MIGYVRPMLLATFVAGVAACSNGSSSPPSLINQPEALKTIELELAKNGYAPEQFNLDLSATQNPPFFESWTFVYGCKPVQTEGCFLFVTIDRVTKRVEILAGDKVKKSAPNNSFKPKPLRGSA